MHPVIAEFGPVTLYAWGLFVALGFMAALIVSIPYGRRVGIASDVLIDLVVLLIVASLAGARAFHVVQSWPEFAGHPERILYVHQGGLVFYGGLISGMAVVVWFARRRKISLLRLLDAAMPGAALGYAIGRIGCFLNGCCFGIETSVPWAVQFPHLPGLRHPTQLYSSAAGLVLFALLAWLWTRRKADGQIFFAGLLGYGAYRFLVEFLRFSPIHFLELTPSQWISMVLIGAGLWGLRKIRIV